MAYLTYIKVAMIERKQSRLVAELGRRGGKPLLRERKKLEEKEKLLLRERKKLEEKESYY